MQKQLINNKNYRAKCPMCTMYGNITEGKVFTGKQWNKILNLKAEPSKLIFGNIEELKLLTQ